MVRALCGNIEPNEDVRLESLLGLQAPSWPKSETWVSSVDSFISGMNGVYFSS